MENQRFIIPSYLNKDVEAIRFYKVLSDGRVFFLREEKNYHFTGETVTLEKK